MDLKVSKSKTVPQNESGEKNPDHMVKRILFIRAELEAHKSRRSAFSGIGAETISWELKQRKVCYVPSIPTIANIRSRHGKTKKNKPKRNSNNQPYPYIKAERIDSNGHLNIPIAKGKASFIRKVDSHGKIIKSFSFPIKGHVVATLLSITRKKT